MTYRKGHEARPYPEAIRPGEAIPWGHGVVFMCPCGRRQVFVSQPPHTITWTDDELLHLDGSVGSRERLRIPGEPESSEAWKSRPANWCHFLIRDGESEMVTDSGCPGMLS